VRFVAEKSTVRSQFVLASGTLVLHTVVSLQMCA